MGISFIYLSEKNIKTKVDLSLIESKNETLEIKKMEDSLKEYEKDLKEITDIQKNHVCWTDVIDIASEFIPEGVEIKSVSFQPAVNKLKGKESKAKEEEEIDYNKFDVNIIGVALKRENLLEFERRIDNSDLFIKSDSEDSSFNKYLKAENVDFKYNFIVERSKLVSVSKN